MKAQEVLDSCKEIIPAWALQQWLHLERDESGTAEADFIRNTLKPGLIRMYASYREQLPHASRPVEKVGILLMQDDILKAIGMADVFLSLHSVYANLTLTSKGESSV